MIGFFISEQGLSLVDAEPGTESPEFVELDGNRFRLLGQFAALVENDAQLVSMYEEDPASWWERAIREVPDVEPIFGSETSPCQQRDVQGDD